MPTTANVPISIEQGATRLNCDTGGLIDITSGRIQLPGNLARGYIPLVAAGTKTTATASGVAVFGSTAVSPRRVQPDVTSGIFAYNWATAQVTPLIFDNVRIPDDLSTAGPLRVVYTAESVSGATNDINVQIRAGLATSTANLGATGALSTSPIERTISVASGSVPASGLIGVTIFPGTHATGAVLLYNAGLSYQRRTS